MLFIVLWQFHNPITLKLLEIKFAIFFIYVLIPRYKYLHQISFILLVNLTQIISSDSHFSINSEYLTVHCTCRWCSSEYDMMVRSPVNTHFDWAMIMKESNLWLSLYLILHKGAPTHRTWCATVSQISQDSPLSWFLVTLLTMCANEQASHVRKPDVYQAQTCLVAAKLWVIWCLTSGHTLKHSFLWCCKTSKNESLCVLKNSQSVSEKIFLVVPVLK